MPWIVPVDPGSLVLDVFELRKQLVGVAGPLGRRTRGVVGEHGIDLGAARLKGRPHIIVEQLDGSQWQFVGIERPQACRLQQSMAVCR
jgi:hypothetical protein